MAIYDPAELPLQEPRRHSHGIEPTVEHADPLDLKSPAAFVVDIAVAVVGSRNPGGSRIGEHTEIPGAKGLVETGADAGEEVDAGVDRRVVVVPALCVEIFFGFGI